MRECVGTLNFAKDVNFLLTYCSVPNNNRKLISLQQMTLFHTMAAFKPTSIGNLAFAHKGFTFNSFSIVFSVLTFQGIVFLESLRKR